MRGLIAITLAAMLAGCGDLYTGSSAGVERYALARIGDDHPPIGLGPDGTAPFLLGDTLELSTSRAREQDILRWIRRYRAGDGSESRSVSEHNYSVDDGVLLFDSCPRESFCIEQSSLVYAPMQFRIVGDSLFQMVVPPFGGKSSVYGRVDRR